MIGRVGRHLGFDLQNVHRFITSVSAAKHKARRNAQCGAAAATQAYTSATRVVQRAVG